MLRTFISEHRWKDGQPTGEEALMTLSQEDDSAIPVPAVFMFAPGRHSAGMGKNSRPPIRRHAAWRDPLDAHQHQDRMPEEATMATERRDSQGIVMRRKVFFLL
ncbi:hypothetical protein MPH_07199 [Macrophomina phaseolina MS6]|uniref:Uncharacterized protein n=1 Tax=Macrophomina phaseolina (strain MS6) TaxID=1126212 RepID=K2RZV4_MACPH|nr:hypothetical protein MPH_07199 [Macrophomina phaseolina MS6]